MYCCACYFFNYLGKHLHCVGSSHTILTKTDRQAFANAYVAGLREDLNLKKNEYSYLLSLFTAGYVFLDNDLFGTLN